MHKTFKRFAVLAVVALCAVCACAFALMGCKKEEKASDSITVKVLYADGTAADGEKDGLSVQFCKMGDEGACGNPVPVGKDGTAKIVFHNPNPIDPSLCTLEPLPTDGHTFDGPFELHILGAEDLGFKKAYGTYTVDSSSYADGKYGETSFPKELVITLTQA